MELASDSFEHQCDELKIDIPVETLVWPKCCIYKVPGALRKLNKEAYTPQLISIGPLHHGNKELADMEMQKLIYLRKFYERTGMKLKDFVRELENDKERIRLIRQCYAEESELCDNEYAKMILLDAVFIIELFKRCHELKRDYMLDKPLLMIGIYYDLLLLENQLPYFVLIDLYNSVFPANDEPTFHELTCKYFVKYKPEGDPSKPDQLSKKKNCLPDQTKVLHFTDLFRYFSSKIHPDLRDKDEKPEGSSSICLCSKKNGSSSIKYLYSATKLHEAGVKFKVIEKECEIEKKCLTDIDFNEGKLIMPRFMVEDRTELVIRNLMALEQCHYPKKAYICNYISLLDFLINTTKDVDLLVEKGVIVNWLGSNEAVAKLVNNLCINIIDSDCDYHGIYEDLNKFYKEPGHRIVAAFWGIYFSDFWRGFSTVAAIVLLFLTVPGTIRSWQAFF